MTTHLATEVREVFVGDTGPPLEFVFRYSDGVTLKDLAGHSAWVSFSYAGSTTHVVRAAMIPSPSTQGIIRYVFLGDEYPTIGRVYVQGSIMAPNYGAYLGVGWNEYSGPILERRVIARPL